MLSLEDCFEFSDLGEAEIEAIARHEHVPMVVAAELGNHLLQTNDGVHCIESMIRECADDAREHGHPEVADQFMVTYRNFHCAHP